MGMDAADASGFVRTIELCGPTQPEFQRHARALLLLDGGVGFVLAI